MRIFSICVILLVFACSSEKTDSMDCEVGLTQQCVCPGDFGAQVCGDAGWGECVCPEPDAGSDSDADADGDADSDIEDAAPDGNDTETSTETSTDSDAGPDTDSDTDSDTYTATDTDTGSETNTETSGVYEDPYSGLMWQNQDLIVEGTPVYAASYCHSLELEGYTDWRVPSISELRTIIRGVPETITGGVCPVTDACWQVACWSNACYGWGSDALGEGPGSVDGCWWDPEFVRPCYTPPPTDSGIWSSTPTDEEGIFAREWMVDFSGGKVYAMSPSTAGIGIICVRG